jgi:hypothetical protein
VLTLARGHYCPKEHQQHLGIAASYPKIAVAYSQLVTISTDDHHTLQEFRASVRRSKTSFSARIGFDSTAIERPFRGLLMVAFSR